MLDQYSVLMSVYAQERADQFRQSLDSIFSQTVPTNDFVLMCDGPLTEELDAVIDEYVRKYGDVLQVIRLDTNQGLARALNRGLQACRNEFVARMDADDVALPNRCELQLRKFAEDPELAIVGGAIDEFEGEPANVISHKAMPEDSGDILRYAKFRNPFNHPTVMYRRSVILAVGSYPDYILHEDYALWATLLLKGYKCCNLPQTLCLMRVDGSFFNRRGGASYLKTAIKLRWHLYRIGLYTFWSFLYVVGGLTLTCLIPRSLRKFLYMTVLRDKQEN